jgi:hypothetical protein
VTDERREDQPGWAAPDSTPREHEPSTWDAPAVPPPGSPPPPGGWFEPTAPAAGVPAVPPPQTAPGAPRRGRGKGWLVALVVVLGAIVAMAVAGTVLFITRTLPPYNAANDFLTDIAHGNRGAAAGQLCAVDVGQSGTIQRVRDRLGSHTKTISVNPFGVDRSGNTARVDFSVSYSDGSSTRNFRIAVVDEQGTWKACP